MHTWNPGWVLLIFKYNLTLNLIITQLVVGTRQCTPGLDLYCFLFVCCPHIFSNGIAAFIQNQISSKFLEIILRDLPRFSFALLLCDTPALLPCYRSALLQKEPIIIIGFASLHRLLERALIGTPSGAPSKMTL